MFHSAESGSLGLERGAGARLLRPSGVAAARGAVFSLNHGIHWTAKPELSELVFFLNPPSCSVTPTTPLYKVICVSDSLAAREI